MNSLALIAALAMAQSSGGVTVENIPGRYKTYDQCRTTLTAANGSVRLSMLHDLSGSRLLNFYNTTAAQEDKVHLTATKVQLVQGDKVLGAYDAEVRAIKRIGAAPGASSDKRGIRISIEPRSVPKGDRFGRWRSPYYWGNLFFTTQIRLLDPRGTALATIDTPASIKKMSTTTMDCLSKAQKAKTSK